MASGVRTVNARLGRDRDGAPVETLVELAHRVGLAAGVVTTTAVPHATPGAFTAHRDDREDMTGVADDQALLTRPEVMLGGGLKWFAPAGPASARTDAGLLAPLADAGYQLVTTSAELAAASPDDGQRLVGLFADDHMDYLLDRAADTTQPTLAAMSLEAIEFLDRDADGFFLMIEGGRIDMASHGNDLPRMVGELLAFDDAVAAVRDWAADRDDVTLLVTADHECGGLAITGEHGQGQLPDVTWRWGQHTNARVDVYGAGPGADVFAGQVRDHTWVHAVAAARLTGAALAEPDAGPVPDGALADLRWHPAAQAVSSGFGPGWNQLDGLAVDATPAGLQVGIEGLFQWDANAVVLLIDADLGAATGPAQLRGAVSDQTGRVDAILSALAVDAPPVSGFGADFALVLWGGADPRVEDLLADGGLRGLTAPVGDPADLWWYGAAVNYGEGVRVRGGAAAAVPGEGLEALIPWTALYPTLGGGVPPGATVGIAALLVNDDGGYTSNQALPPFAADTANPGRTAVPLPGLVRFQVDADTDGTADGAQAPVTLP
jgi:alkaline phosphatase